MTNLVILYVGNVGSTPLVQVAKQHPKTCVPIIEEFDEYEFIPHCGEENLFDALAETLDALYQRKRNAYLDGETVRRHRDTDEFPSVEMAPHMVFKWRPNSYRQRRAGSAVLPPVFAKHNVKAAVLARRSAVERALKVMMTEAQTGTKYPQFRAEKMSDAEYKAYMQEQAEVSIRIEGDDLVNLRELARSYYGKTWVLVHAAMFQFAHLGGPPPLIVSEQILKPEIDYDAVSDVLSALLCDDIRLTNDMAPTVRRAGLGIENCANLDELANDPELRDIERRYQLLLRKLTPVLGDWEPAGLFSQLRDRFSPPPVALGENLPIR
ncbi:MAG: hypothetical protein AAFO80_04565 [Pseudomonadota bacterium]